MIFFAFVLAVAVFVASHKQINKNTAFGEAFETWSAAFGDKATFGEASELWL